VRAGKLGAAKLSRQARSLGGKRSAAKRRAPAEAAKEAAAAAEAADAAEPVPAFNTLRTSPKSWNRLEAGDACRLGAVAVWGCWGARRMCGARRLVAAS
jgi:hypothetical protein